MPLIDPNIIEDGSPIWTLAQLFPPQGSWSSDEYLQLDAGRLVEFEGGKLEIHAMPTPEHQTLVLIVYRYLYAWTQQLAEPGEVFVAPLPIRLWSEKFREPDVAWIGTGRARTGGYPDGADFVVEVTSPGAEARKRDFIVKSNEYARAGILEYWIVDTELRQVQVGALVDGHYEFQSYVAGEAAVSARYPTLQLPLSELFPPEPVSPKP